MTLICLSGKSQSWGLQRHISKPVISRSSGFQSTVGCWLMMLALCTLSFMHALTVFQLTRFMACLQRGRVLQCNLDLPQGLPSVTTNLQVHVRHVASKRYVARPCVPRVADP